MKKLGKVGVIGRFKPLHKGGAVMLESICEQAEHVTIGIGSSNKYNARNPWTAEESQAMIDAFLSPNFSNYSFVHVRDFAHLKPEYRDGQRWKQEILSLFGSLDAFVNGNDYVDSLLRPDYRIIHPAEFIPEEKQIMLKATQVRVAMAQGGDWKQFVPDPVAKYLEGNNLVERFRKEFGLQTLVQLASGEDYRLHEDADAEKNHTYEV